MSSTLLRLGLWIIFLVIAAYVVHETYSEQQIAEYIPVAMLGKSLALGAVLVAGGLVMRMLEKGAKVVQKNRCVVCRSPVPQGAIYCREHLRGVLHREDERTHMTKVKR